MAKPKAKQLDIVVGQARWNTSFAGTIPGANSMAVTTAFSGMTAGGTDSVVGVYTTPPQNKVYLRNRQTGKAFQDSNGQQVIGRLTESTGVWTLSFFVISAGSETAYNFTGSTDVGATFDMRWCESIQLKDALPTAVVDYAEGIDEIDPSSPLIHQHQVDYFTATAAQVNFTSSATPKDATDAALFVNGIRYKYTTDFTFVGTAVTWLNTDFTLAAGDIVTLEYAKA